MQSAVQQKQKLSLRNFEVIRNLGDGAFGDVYLVKTTVGQSLFALKQIDKGHVTRYKKSHHIFREQYVLDFIKSKYIVQLFGTFQDQNNLYFLLQYLPYGDLSWLIFVQEKFDASEVKLIAANIVRILQELRKYGLAHWDLKPENLIFNQEGFLTAVDFGTCEIYQENNQNEKLYEKLKKLKEQYKEQETQEINQRWAGSFIGTLFYMAPEMIVEQNVDFSADLWALGIIIYRLFTGKYLFQEQNDYQMMERIWQGNFTLPNTLPENAQDLLRKLLRINPQERIGRNLEDLKSHDFFQGIDWEKETDFRTVFELEKFAEEISQEEEEALPVQSPAQEKKIILTGLVKKMKFIVMYNTRQLILFSNKTMLYLDPKNNKLKGSIKIDSSCKVYQTQQNEFIFARPEREYTFRTIDTQASKWVEEISRMIN